MSETRATFKRMVVTLPRSREDYAAVGLTAQLAELLGLDLLATFIEDATLTELAALPCVRELRPLGGGWRPIDVAQLARELEHAAAAAHRFFEQTVRTERIAAQFNRARGSVAEVVRALAQADDIIVIIEPKNPAERVTHQFRWLVDVAFEAASAVMVVPSQIVRTAGPIVAVAANEHDLSIRSAIAIASAVKERAIVLGTVPPAAPPAVVETANAAGVPIDIQPALPSPLDAAALLARLSHVHERLVVMTRGTCDDAAALMIASARGVPVLVVEPEEKPAST